MRLLSCVLCCDIQLTIQRIHHRCSPLLAAAIIRHMRDSHYGDGVNIWKIPIWEWPKPVDGMDVNPQPAQRPSLPLPTVEPVTYDNHTNQDVVGGVAPSAGLLAVAAAVSSSSGGAHSFSAADRARAIRSTQRVTDENQTMELNAGDIVIVTQSPNDNGEVASS